MRSVRKKNTAPELVVRRFLHRKGLRFRVNVTGLPGTPDIVLPKWAAVVFVHGCFWHGHSCSHGRVVARHNAEFWAAKIAVNRVRDAQKTRALRRSGWLVLRVWECQCDNARALEALCTRIQT